MYNLVAKISDIINREIKIIVIFNNMDVSEQMISNYTEERGEQNG